jgi:hypothetical protein
MNVPPSMSMTTPTHTWRYSKARLQKTAAIVFAMAMVFGLFGAAHWFGAVMALFAAGVGVYTLILAQSDRPVLTIGPEGLRYARFSSRTVPWSEITEVAVVRGVQRGVAWGKAHYKPSPTMDEINFSLRSYDGYSGALRNALRGLRTMFGLPGVQCLVAYLDGPSVDDVARAIQSHWQGTIQDMVAIEGRFSKTPWTGAPPPLPL